jgi:hypothetical protein
LGDKALGHDARFGRFRPDVLLPQKIAAADGGAEFAGEPKVSAIFTVR